MTFKNQKGVALPLVLMTMVVLTILGIALWQYSMADTIQVARSEHKLQAHYLGRSGVEIGLGVIIELLSQENEYLDSEGILNDLDTLSGVVDPAGEYEVSFTALDDSRIKILSIGTSNNVQDLVTLTISFVEFPDFLPIAPNPTEWINGVSHEVRQHAESNSELPYPDGQKYLNNAVVLYSDTPAPIRLSANQEVQFYAAGLYFLQHIYDPSTGQSLLVPDGNKAHLTLNAKYMEFKEDVFMEYANSNRLGRLTLKGTYPSQHPLEGEARGFTYEHLENLIIDHIDKNPGEDELLDLFYSYGLEEEQIYGLVNFMGNLELESFTTPYQDISGYYLFYSLDGVNLHEDDSVTNDLIPIDERLGDIWRPDHELTPWYTNPIWGRS